MGFRSGSNLTNRADLTGNFINIDKLCDLLTLAQSDNKVEPTFVEAEINDVGKKEKSSQETPHDTSFEDLLINGEDNIPKSRNAIKCGKYMMTLNDRDTFNDKNEYICSYCTKLGYGSKYLPDECDSCDECLDCVEYEEGDCSGCSYSIHRDGKFYREKLSDEEYYDPADIEIFNNLENNKELCIRKTRKAFADYQSK